MEVLVTQPPLEVLVTQPPQIVALGMQQQDVHYVILLFYPEGV